jgi:hypothetical protein
MPNKIIVAIHGVGDQRRCETIQLVVRQFAQYCAAPLGFPLGGLNAELFPLPGGAAGPGAYLVKSPPFSGPLGFAEVYWAGIPRDLAKDGYILEDVKQWGATVVERVRAIDEKVHGCRPGTDAKYGLAADVIDELIQTIGVLGVLLYLLGKANLFTFDLNKILVDYVDDVQVVAEFGNYRGEILKTFHAAMKAVYDGDPNAEIYIVAHSEGTVVAFLGILEAISRLPGEEAGKPAASPWVKQLRGLMTIGSPLNKHVLLWPELFDKLTPPTRQTTRPIHWVNYYDYGDPIGFELEATRRWMDEKEHHWRPFFEFDPNKDDVGFTRYLFPGKAHIDYWQDKDVFGHFIEHVVQLPPRLPPAAGAAPAAGGTKPKSFERPVSTLTAQIFSPTLPYLWAAILLFIGVFLMYKAVVGYTLPFKEPPWSIFRNVFAIGLLLIGVTAAVRIPRLTNVWQWRTAGVLLFFAGVILFPFILTPGAKYRLGFIFLIGKEAGFGDGLIAVLNQFAAYLPWLGVRGPTFGILALALFTTLIIYLLSRMFPRWGVTPLILGGGAVVLGVAGMRMFDTNAREKFMAARAALAGRLPEERLDEASADLLERYVSAGSHAGDFDHFLEAERSNLLKEGHYKEDAERTAAATAKAKERAPSAPAKEESAGAASDTRPVWPVILAGAIFLYLWWLAAHVFDLIVVWQHYIRSSAILDRLNKARGLPPRSTPTERAAGLGA